MKVTISNVQTTTLMLNRDESIALARMLKQQKHLSTIGTMEQRLCHEIVENITVGLEVSV
jgi:hypothetical protein